MSKLTPPVGPNDHAQGPADAPVTLVEYGDYECPYCGETYPVIKAAQRAMGDRMRFVFRNFPLVDMHPHAAHAAEFAESAAAIGQFWAAHDMLYEHQEALRDGDLIRYGEKIGLDGEAVMDAFDGRHNDKLQADFSGGVRSGVNGTPTLFINGHRYDGDRDVQSLVAALSAAAGL